MAVQYPDNYRKMKERFPELMPVYESAGETARKAGPIPGKYTHLIQLAGCVGLRSEGGVHSHTRRALEAGASPDEIYHTLALLISTAGFPVVSAAFSWVNDIIEK